MARILAGFLGAFSIGLGLAELIGPGRLAKTYNMEGKEALIMTFGARELCAGIGIFLRIGSPNDKLRPWLNFRVAGDALDLPALISARDGAGDREQNVNTAIAAVSGITLLDIICARGLKN